MVNAVKGVEDDCEIFISNNCSTDETAQVMKDWTAKCPHADFRVFYQSENLGAILTLPTVFIHLQLSIFGF